VFTPCCKFNYKGTLCSHRVANLVTRTVANERVQQNGLLVSLCERERERERERDRVRMDASLCDDFVFVGHCATA
jgi:hypothetical protein